MYVLELNTAGEPVAAPVAAPQPPLATGSVAQEHCGFDTVTRLGAVGLRQTGDVKRVGDTVDVLHDRPLRQQRLSSTSDVGAIALDSDRDSDSDSDVLPDRPDPPTCVRTWGASGGQNRLLLHKADFNRLLVGCELNDEVINFVIRMWRDTVLSAEVTRCYTFDTYLWNRLALSRPGTFTLGSQQRWFRKANVSYSEYSSSSAVYVRPVCMGRYAFVTVCVCVCV